MHAVRAGEFEPHVGCWMGWPYSPYLWRDNAKPAQQQYAAVAKAISQFEPLWMFADPSVRITCLGAWGSSPYSIRYTQARQGQLHTHLALPRTRLRTSNHAMQSAARVAALLEVYQCGL